MARLLQINSSIFGTGGVSTQLADHWRQRWQQANPDGEVVVRDLSNPQIPHLDAATITAFATPAEERDDAQKTKVAYADELLAEVTGADVILLTLPMYNFGGPSTLKAYFDHLARAGVSFKYTENGPVGLLEDKPVHVFASRGGLHSGTERDVQTSFIKLFLGFVGIKDVNFIYAEGVNLGEDARAQALAQAQSEIEAQV